MPIVNIPGVGQVNFPSSMSNEDIAAAARKLYEQKQGVTPQAQAQPAPAPPAPNVDGQQAPQAPPELRQQAPEPALPGMDLSPMEAEAKLSADSGLIEAGLHMARGAVGTVIGGVIAAPLIGDPELAANVYNKWSARITGTPKTPEGRRATEIISKPFAYVEDKIDRGAWAISGEHPLVATTIKTGIEAGLQLFGLKLKGRQAALAAAKTVDRTARNMGIELGAADFPEQVKKAVDSRIGESRGDFMDPIRQKLTAMRNEQKKVADAAFEKARGMNASIRSRTINELKTDILYQLTKNKKYDLEMMPYVKARLADLDKMAQPENEVIYTPVDPSTALGRSIKKAEPAPDRLTSLNDLADFRERIRSNRPAASDADQHAALQVMKGQFDEFLDRKLQQDMIVGDPEALAQWKEARSLWKDWKSRFSDNKTIRQLMDANASVEDLRKFFQGLSQSGAKTEAAMTVRRLKDLLGKDSAEMQGLRREFIFDYMQPLLEETPNIERFVARYDKVHKHNPTLVRELDPFTATEMDKIYQYVKAYEKIGPVPKFQANLSTMLSRLLVGHGIAKAAVKVSLVKTLVDIISHGGKAATKRAMIEEILGYDPKKPFIDPKTVAGQAVLIGEMQDRTRQAYLEQQ